jgi:hypothetical protein
MDCPACGQQHDDGPCPARITESVVPPTPPSPGMTVLHCPECGRPLPRPNSTCPACTRTHPLAGVPLILGILGLLSYGITALIGLIIGITILREMQRAPHLYSTTERNNVIGGTVASAAVLLLIGSCAAPAMMSSFMR